MNKKFKVIQEQFLREQTIESLEKIYKSENALKRSIGRVVLLNLIGLFVSINITRLGRGIFTLSMTVSILLLFAYHGKQKLISLIGNIIEEKTITEEC